MPRGPEIADFAEKLRLVLVSANMSRAQLAQAVGVNKSAVARWLNGAFHPGDHTLTKLSVALAKVIDGLKRADWDLATTEFAARLDLPPTASAHVQLPEAPSPPEPSDPLAIARARASASPEMAARAYSGLWFFLQPSAFDRGNHPPLGCWTARIRRSGSAGALETEIGIREHLVGHGTALPLQDRLYMMHATQRVSGLGLSLNIFHGVSLGRAAVLDGIAVTTELTDAATPHAFRVVGFRLSEATDDAAFAEVLRRSDRLRLDGMNGAVPGAVIEALLTPTSAARRPGRIRLPSGESWSCPEPAALARLCQAARGTGRGAGAVRRGARSVGACLIAIGYAPGCVA